MEAEVFKYPETAKLLSALSPDQQYRPRKISIDEGVDHIWIFQGNPEVYDIYQALRDEEVNEELHWRVSRYTKEISKDDIALIWISGKRAGIFAIMQITSDPEFFLDNEAEKKYWIKKPEIEVELPGVKLKLIQLFEPPISKEILKRNGLQNLSIIKQPQGTNFKVTSEEWYIIEQLIKK